jgi:hypothetical protein|tara:strand:- start:183 stop:434 length:252 start_codon:yes stop_codon:yes gene_type:complete
MELAKGSLEIATRREKREGKWLIVKLMNHQNIGFRVFPVDKSKKFYDLKSPIRSVKSAEMIFGIWNIKIDNQLPSTAFHVIFD